MSLIVYDDYVNKMAKYLKKQYENLDDSIGAYIEIMEEAIDRGITEGQTSTALREFLSQVYISSGAKDSSGYATGAEYSRFLKNYVIKLDDADKDLY